MSSILSKAQPDYRLITRTNTFAVPGSVSVELIGAAVESLRRVPVGPVGMGAEPQSAAIVDFAFQGLSGGSDWRQRVLAIAAIPESYPALSPQIEAWAECSTALVIDVPWQFEHCVAEEPARIKAAEGWARLMQYPEGTVAGLRRSPDRENDVRVVVQPRPSRRVVMKIVQRSKPGPTPILD